MCDNFFDTWDQKTIKFFFLNATKKWSQNIKCATK
jgi:hypothetical protein